MMNHITPKIGLALLEGQLDAAQQAQVEKHLVDCPVCQAQLQEHQTAHNLLQAAGKDFSIELTQVPKWSDIRPKDEARPLLKTLFQYSGQLIMAGAAFIVLLIFIWQLRPQEPTLDLAPSVTVTGRPVFGPTPIATGLPDPAVTSISSVDPTQTIPEPTPDPLPTTQETGPSAIIADEISAVSLSSQGRAAFVADDKLYMETAVQSATFTVVAEQVQARPPAWSADGQELLFFSQPNPNDHPIIIHWTAESGKLTPLSDLIDRPLPDLSFRNTKWAKDGREILLPAFGKLSADSEWDSSVWLADLDAGTMTLLVEAIALKDITWLNTDEFIITLDCGRDCTIMMAYNKTKTLLWKAYADRLEREAATDQFILQPYEQRILYLNTFDNPQTLDELNTETGSITTILTLTEGLQFAAQPPQLAENGRILVYQLTDENNQPIIQTVNLDDLTTDTLTLQHETFTFDSGGAWDMAGNYFVYSVSDPTIGAAYVYLWQPANDTTNLIQAVAGEEQFQNFTWTADSRYLYYNLGNRILWQYDLVTEELHAVAGQ